MGIMGIFLIMGNAGFVSSTVCCMTKPDLKLPSPTSFLVGPLKPLKKILPNRVLLSPRRENIKYPKGLSSFLWVLII